ncbi:MAG: hypothetical protein AAFY31_07525, partial [Pseudomonadota bacterium]
LVGANGDMVFRQNAKFLSSDYLPHKLQVPERVFCILPKHHIAVRTNQIRLQDRAVYVHGRIQYTTGHGRR